VRKNRERAILETVYSRDSFDRICESESPDFKLRHRNEDRYFGVEVTEFFLFEADARIKNIPGYMSELFAGGKPRHKDDVDLLKVEKAVWRKANSSEEEVIDVIKRQLPQVSRYVRMVVDKIDRKDRKLEAYERGLSHVNLIVLDHEKRLITTSPEYFYSYFFTPELNATLTRTGFREVFFVTTLKETRRVYIPLKGLFLLSNFYMFYWAHEEYQPNKEYGSIRAELEPFAEFMLRQNAPVAFAEGTEGEAELLWSNYGIHVNNSGITIRDYADHALPQKTLFKESVRVTLLDSPFLAFLERFRKRNTFVSNMAFDVIRDAPL
jgi:hypothetical protein